MTMEPVGLLRQGEAKVPSELEIRKAAEEFEGLLIGQMLQSIRESALGGWQQEKQDSASSVALEMAEGQLARTMAASGGLGLARMLSENLNRNAQTESGS